VPAQVFKVPTTPLHGYFTESRIKSELREKFRENKELSAVLFEQVCVECSECPILIVHSWEENIEQISGMVWLNRKLAELINDYNHGLKQQARDPKPKW
jgi:hypothetical protein